MRFTKEESEVERALPRDPARYIRTFGVISVVKCVLLRRRMFKISKDSFHTSFVFEVFCNENHFPSPGGDLIDFWSCGTDEIFQYLWKRPTVFWHCDFSSKTKLVKMYFHKVVVLKKFCEIEGSSEFFGTEASPEKIQFLCFELRTSFFDVFESYGCKEPLKDPFSAL